MESEDGDIVQRVEKVTLRRKLTGPPRLLLPSRARRTDGHKTQTNNNESSQAKTIAQDVLSAVQEGGSRGRCQTAVEDDDIRNRKVKRRRWWRRFTLELECVRRQRTKDGDIPPEGALQEMHEPAPIEKEKSEEVKTGRSRFKVKTWSRIRRMQDFLSRGWRRRRSNVDEEEETEQNNEGKCSPDGLTTRGSVEVMAEVSDEPPGAARVETCDLKEEEEAEGQTSDTPDEDLKVVPSAEGVQEETDHSPSRFLCPNGPSILIQLVPPDEETLDEEEEVWELSTSSGNQNLLFLLLASEPGEQQLLQTARSLVRAAMSAAVDQLSRERRETNCLEGPDLTLTAERSKVNL